MIPMRIRVAACVAFIGILVGGLLSVLTLASTINPIIDIYYSVLFIVALLLLIMGLMSFYYISYTGFGDIKLIDLAFKKNHSQRDTIRK